MTQLKFYKFAALGMLVLNLAIITFFLLTKPTHRHKKGGHPHKVAKEILQLDEEQNEKFLQLAQQHKQLMRDLNKEQRNILQNYFTPLMDKNFSQNRDSILIEIQNIERKKIESIDQHFENIKVILKPNQQENFKDFVQHLLKKILSTSKNKPHTRKKRLKEKTK